MPLTTQLELEKANIFLERESLTNAFVDSYHANNNKVWIEYINSS